MSSIPDINWKAVWLLVPPVTPCCGFITTGVGMLIELLLPFPFETIGTTIAIVKAQAKEAVSPAVIYSPLFLVFFFAVSFFC